MRIVEFSLPKSVLLAFLALLGALLLSGHVVRGAPPGTLYGVTVCCPVQLVSIDPASGALTVVGTVGGSSDVFTAAAAVDPAGKRFFVAKRFPARITTINTDTGVSTNSPTLAQDIVLLAFHSGTSTLFGVTACCPNQLVSINLSSGALAAVTNVGGASDVLAAAVAIDASTNRLFLAKRSPPRIVTVNTSTGSTSESSTLSSEILLLGFNSASGSLIGITGSMQVVTINPSTGAFTLLSTLTAGNLAVAATVDTETSRFYVARRAPPRLLGTNTGSGATTESPTLSQEILLLGFVPGASISVSVAPSSSTRAVTHRDTFTVTLTNTTNTSVEWRVNNVVGGNTTVGQICATGTNNCGLAFAVTSAANVDYLAPASVSATNPVTLTAISQADPTRSGSAQVTIIPNVQVSVSPPSVTLATNATQLFSASVVGTSNTNVTWSVSGAGCTGAACGTIDATGLYTAPGTAPNPNSVTVTATSVDDTNQKGTATVTIATTPFIRTMQPSSATAGATSFTLKVQGINFIATSGTTGSVIVFAGSDKTTNCISTTECTAMLEAADVASAGNKTVQIRNPGPPAVLSNQVNFVVVADATTEDVVALTSVSPSATGKDISVVDPTTAAAATGVLPPNIKTLGVFNQVSGSCLVSNSAIALQRPQSGTSAVEICVSGDDLVTGHTYAFSGPNDITISAPEALGTNFIKLTLTLSSTTKTGPRTLLVTSSSKDKSAATGAIEVK